MGPINHERVAGMNETRMPLACRFGLHSWGPWEDLGDGVRTFWNNVTQPVLFQETRCERCRKAKRKVVSYKTA